MKQRKVRFGELQDAQEFVRQAEKCEFDIDVFYNRIIIDAKSILGVMSLDLTNVLTVEYQGDNSTFEQFLDQYAIA